MKKYSWILVVAAVAPLFPLACGGGTTGTTSTGAGGGSGGTAPTTTTGSHTTTGSMTTTTTGSMTTTTTTTAATGTGGGGPVDCTTVFPAGDCDTCGEANCCAEGSTCNDTAGCVDCLPDASLCDATNQDAHDALIACLQASCDKECFAQPMPPDATCTVPLPSPSAGACITLSGTVTCNPVSNAPCTVGQACDFGGGGFKCYDPPNNAKLCGACDAGAGPFCTGGETCDNGICVKFCCDDGDCGAGKCDKTGMIPGGAGECLGGNGGTSSSSASSSSASSSASSSSASSSVSSSVSSAAASGSSSSTGP